MNTLHPPRGLQAEHYRRAREELDKLALQPATEPAMQIFGSVPQLQTVPDDIDKLASQLERLAGGPATSNLVDESPTELAAELEKAAAHADSGQTVVEKLAMLLVGLEAHEQVLEELEA